jgi:hypothetical protein
MAVIAGMDHWLCRSACSYALIPPSRSPINSVRLPTRCQCLKRDDGNNSNNSNHRHSRGGRRRTDLKPHLLIQSSNLLRGRQRRGLLALRLHRKMAIHLRVSCQRTVMGRHASWRRRLGMGHLLSRRSSSNCLARAETAEELNNAKRIARGDARCGAVVVLGGATGAGSVSRQPSAQLALGRQAGVAR